MPYKLIKEFGEMLGGDPVFTVHGPISILTLSIPWLVKDHRKIPLLCVNRGRETFAAISETLYRSEGKEMLKRYHQGEITLAEMRRQYDEFAAVVEALYIRVLGYDLEKTKDSELAALAKELVDIFIELANKTLYIETVDYDMILEVIGQDKKAALDAVWEQATHPTFLSFEGRRLKTQIDALANASTDPFLSVRYIYTDYSWSKTESEIRAALDDIRVHMKAKQEEYEKLAAATASRKKEFDALKNTLPEETNRVLDYMQLVMHLRDVRKDMIAQLQTVIIDVVSVMFDRAGIDRKYAPFSCLFECIKGIDYLRKNKVEIEARPAGAISIMYSLPSEHAYEFELCDFDAAVDEFHKLVATVHDRDTALKGQIANRGKVVGTVKIIIDPHDDKGFKEGEILVTSMTRPEFVPLMKKAGGVITNEGGITCHAAIVSRELGIPCIIATKVATKVLKDGDMVELDAERGIVTITSPRR